MHNLFFIWRHLSLHFNFSFSLSFSLCLSAICPIPIRLRRKRERPNAIISNNRKRLPAATICANDMCVRERGACDHKIYIKFIAHQAPICAPLFSVSFSCFSPHAIPLFSSMSTSKRLYSPFHCCDLSKCHLFINGHNLLNGFL